MSIEDEAKPSDRPRKKQPPKAKTPSEIKHSPELETQLTELVSMLRGANLPAVFDNQSKLETKIEALVKAAEEQTKAEKLRAEHDEKRFKKLQEDHLELIGHVKKIAGIVPRIEEFSSSFAEISGGVKTIDSRLDSLSDGVVELKTFAEGQQMNLFTMIESAAETKASLTAIGAGLEGIADKTVEIEEKLTSGHAAINQQLELFAENQQAITASLDGLRLAVEPLATRQDVALTVEASRRKTRRTIKTLATLGHREGQKGLSTIQKNLISIARQVLKASGNYSKALVDKSAKETVGLTDATKALTASVAESTAEIQESKAILKAGSGAIVNAQRALLDIGPFAQDQITSSMNMVVTTVAPQVSNLFRSLIDTSDLKSIPAFVEQFKILHEQVEESIDSLRNVEETVVSSNNYAANSNRDLLSQMENMRSLTDELIDLLSGEKLLAASTQMHGLSESFNHELERYKGSIEGVFSNLTNVLVKRFAGQLETLVDNSKITQEELSTMGSALAEAVTNNVLAALFEDARKDA